MLLKYYFLLNKFIIKNFLFIFYTNLILIIQLYLIIIFNILFSLKIFYFNL